MSRRGVPVFNAPGANANAVKELVVAAIFLAARNLVRRDRRRARARAGAGLRAARGGGQEAVRGRRGARQDARRGRAGRHRGARRRRRAQARASRRGLRPAGHGRRRCRACRRRCASRPRSTRCFATADFVTLHVPLIEATRHLADARRLALVPPGRGAPQLLARRHRRRGGRRRRGRPRDGSRPTSATFPSPRFAGQPGHRRAAAPRAPRPRRRRRRARRW